MRPPERIHVLETCLYVDDLAAAEAFYHDLLGLSVVSRQEGRHVFFRCGHGMLLLFRPEGSLDEEGELPPHGTHGPGHVAFAVEESHLAAWRQHLREGGVAIEREMEWPNGAISIYFRDPAGNSLELAVDRLWDLAVPDLQV